MSNLLQIFNEAIPISKYRKYHHIERDKTFERYLEYIFNELKSLPNAFAARHGYRVYIPFDADNSVVKSEIRKEVEQVLNDNGYEVLDYYKGFAIEKGNKKRKIKIGKILSRLGKKDLLNKFSSDPARNAASKNEKMLIVFSYHPYDIAGMSYNRDWDSCMNIDTGTNKSFVECDIRLGTFIAYLISVDDKNIVKPLARVLCKPHLYRGYDVNEVIYRPSTVYGNAPPAFKTKIEEILKDISVFSDEPGYVLHPDLYADRDDVPYNPFDALVMYGEYEPDTQTLIIRHDDDWFDMMDDFLGDINPEFLYEINTIIIEGADGVSFDARAVSIIVRRNIRIFLSEEVEALSLVISGDDYSSAYNTFLPEYIKFDHLMGLRIDYRNGLIYDEFFGRYNEFENVDILAGIVYGLPSKVHDTLEVVCNSLDLTKMKYDYEVGNYLEIRDCDDVRFVLPKRYDFIYFKYCTFDDLKDQFDYKGCEGVGEIMFDACTFVEYDESSDGNIDDWIRKTVASGGVISEDKIHIKW